MALVWRWFLGVFFFSFLRFSFLLILDGGWWVVSVCFILLCICWRVRGIDEPDAINSGGCWSESQARLQLAASSWAKNAHWKPYFELFVSGSSTWWFVSGSYKLFLCMISQRDVSYLLPWTLLANVVSTIGSLTSILLSFCNLFLQKPWIQCFWFIKNKQLDSNSTSQQRFHERSTLR